MTNQKDNRACGVASTRAATKKYIHNTFKVKSNNSRTIFLKKLGYFAEERLPSRPVTPKMIGRPFCLKDFPHSNCVSSRLSRCWCLDLHKLPMISTKTDKSSFYIFVSGKNFRLLSQISLVHWAIFDR